MIFTTSASLNGGARGGARANPSLTAKPPKQIGRRKDEADGKGGTDAISPRGRRIKEGRRASLLS